MKRVSHCAAGVLGLALSFAGAAFAQDMAAHGDGGMGHATPIATTAPAAAKNEIVIDNFAFAPAQLTVPRGTRLTWTNRDDDPHTVTSATDPKAFKSPALDTGESFAVTFDQPGTYHYFCSIHPHMEGTIVVQ
jgi:plastocyanin